jgi:O-antigen ligase
MTSSRSGMLSLALAFTLGVHAALRHQHGTLARSVTVGALVLASIGIVVWAGTATLVARFVSPDTVALGGRLPIWDRSLQIFGDFWIAGSGLNTYGAATLLYPEVVAGHHLREAHNDYLQLAIEGGLLLGVPLVAAVVTFAAAVRRQFSSSTDWTYWIRLGAVTGILAVAVQSIVEFSLQMPGNASFFAVLCAIAIHRRGSPPTAPDTSPSAAPAPPETIQSSAFPLR